VEPRLLQIDLKDLAAKLASLNHRPFRLHTLSTAFFHSSRRNFGHDDQSKIRKEFLLLYQLQVRFQHLRRSSFLSENHVGHICGHKCNQIAVLSKHPDARGLRTNANSSTESRACAAPCTYTLVSVADLIISDGLIEVFSQSGNCGNRKGWVAFIKASETKNSSPYHITL